MLYRSKQLTIRVNPELLDKAFQKFYDSRSRYTRRYYKVSTADMIEYLLTEYCAEKPISDLSDNGLVDV
jgi:hypothetical protein